jgi:hypothetical protein
MAFWASVWDAIAPPIDTDQGSVPFGEAAAGARTTPGAAAVSATQAPATVARLGFDSDVPWGGANKMQPGGDYPDGRANFMSSLYTAYVGCPWLAAPIDVIARTVTAGGVQITPTSEADDQTTADPPPQVQALQQLLDFCNPHMDIVQLLRGVVVDLGIYGDAFLEVVWLLGLPVALFPLDPATMSVDADEHGEVTGYDQVLDTREVHFEPHQIIHISMDAPKGSLYGMGIAQKALLPTTVWLFTEACIKETMRRGDPPHIHVDWPLAVQPDDVRAWRGQYRARNLGPQNIGNPIARHDPVGGGGAAGEGRRHRVRQPGRRHRHQPGQDVPQQHVRAGREHRAREAQFLADPRGFRRHGLGDRVRGRRLARRHGRGGDPRQAAPQRVLDLE